MDQGNTDPNNQPPNNGSGVQPPVPQSPNSDQPGAFSQSTDTSTPSQVTPSASFMTDNPSQPVAPLPVPPSPGLSSEPQVDNSNWTVPSTPPEGSIPPVVSSQADVNPFVAVNPSPVEPNQGSSPTSFNPFATPTVGFAASPVSSTPETVPTDLSNLVNTPSEATSYVPQTDTTSSMSTAQPEPLVTNPSLPSEAPQAVSATGGAGGFPKILIIIGGIVLLVAIAASAYFILGIGKPTEPAPDSIPAVQATPTPTSIPAPLAPGTISPTPVSSTSSASFSNLPGTNVTPTATPVAGGSGNAYQRLLQQRQASTSSANP